MSSQPLILSDSRLVAEFVRQTEFKAFFEKRFAVPPDYAALLFRNGELVDAFKGGHFSVGGLVNKLKGIVGGAHHIGMLLADLKPFTVQTVLKGLSRDKVEIAGVATLELQVDPDTPQNILGFMHGVRRRTDDEGQAGRLALTKDDVLERIRPHLTDRVVEHILGRMDATEIRGEVGLQDNLQGNIMREVERVVGDLGLMVRAVSVEWAQNAAEAEAIERAEIEREQAAIDWKMELLKRDMERQSDSTRFRIETALDLQKVENAAEDELRLMALNSEIQFVDAREQAQRRQELDVIGHEIEVLRAERVGRFENEIAEAGHVIDVTRKRADLRKIEREIEFLDHQQAAELKKIAAFADDEIVRREQERQVEHLRSLSQLEQDTEDSEADRRIREKDAGSRREIDAVRADADARVAQLKAGASMTEAQILAINAGLSPDVAAVLAEQARASATGNAETQALMREMIDAAKDARVASEAQAREMFRMGMEGAVGVAHGAGGGNAPSAPTAGASEAASQVECPKCGRTNTARANFCVGCGHKLRT